MIKSPKFEAWIYEEEPNERSAYWVVVFDDGYGNLTTIKKIFSDDRWDPRAEECAAALNKAASFY